MSARPTLSAIEPFHLVEAKPEKGVAAVVTCPAMPDLLIIEMLTLFLKHGIYFESDAKLQTAHGGTCYTVKILKEGHDARVLRSALAELSAFARAPGIAGSR